MNKLSIVVITRNEAAAIERCLESAKWADEIVIVDSSSTDDTLEICRRYTDRIFDKDMDGFGDQKQFGVEKASNNWILSLDADEVVTPALAAEIRELLSGEPGCDGYRIYRKNRYMGRWMKHCGWYVPILRLFRKDRGRFNSARVHEEVVVRGKVCELKSEILHYTYRDTSDHLKKMNMFSSLDAEELIKKGVVLKWHNLAWYLLFKPLAVFIRKYFLLRGFMEGVPGFILSVYTAIGVFIIYTKLWEKQRVRTEED